MTNKQIEDKILERMLDMSMDLKIEDILGRDPTFPRTVKIGDTYTFRSLKDSGSIEMSVTRLFKPQGPGLPVKMGAQEIYKLDESIFSDFIEQRRVKLIWRI